MFLISALIILGSNAFHGNVDGLIKPIAGNGDFDHQYWQDVNKMYDIPSTLKMYEALQPTLGIHSRVHPPGPMIFIYILRSVFDNPIWVSVVILALGLLGGVFVYDIAKGWWGDEIAKVLAGLFLVLPAIQIYYWCTVDAFMSTLFIATFWAWQKRRNYKWVLVAGIILMLSLSMTFAAVILVPLLILDEWIATKKWQRILILLGMLLMGWFGIKQLSGYDWISSFLTAKKFEGSHGFYLFYHAPSYITTRIEDVLEILVFFGPYLSYILFYQIKTFINKREIKKPYVVGIIMTMLLILFFLAGAYFTGETARAAVYIYPFLILIVGQSLAMEKINPTQQKLLLSLVFAQSILMQMFGWYAW